MAHSRCGEFIVVCSYCGEFIVVHSRCGKSLVLGFCVTLTKWGGVSEVIPVSAVIAVSALQCLLC